MAKMTDSPRPCPICNLDHTEIWFRSDRAPGPVVRCQRCGLVYVSPILNRRALIQDGPLLGSLDPAVLHSADLSGIAGCPEQAQLPATEAEGPALRRNAAHALDRIRRYAQPPGRLLDFGCGWGFFLATAKERGWEPFGLEPLPWRAIYARAMFGATVVTDTLRQDSFPVEFLDVVTSFQVFEHLPDPAADLARLYRFLKPRGLLLVEVPNVETWGVRLLGARHRHFHPDHFTYFSHRTLSLLLETQGFEELDSYHPARHMTGRRLAAVWGRRLLPRRAAHAAEALTYRLGLTNKILTIDLGDIVAVIARKRP